MHDSTQVASGQPSPTPAVSTVSSEIPPTISVSPVGDICDVELATRNTISTISASTYDPTYTTNPSHSTSQGMGIGPTSNSETRVFKLKSFATSPGILVSSKGCKKRKSSKSAKTKQGEGSKNIKEAPNVDDGTEKDIAIAQQGPGLYYTDDFLNRLAPALFQLINHARQWVCYYIMAGYITPYPTSSRYNNSALHVILDHSKKSLGTPEAGEYSTF
jgi:hypothetical protein